MALKQVWVLHIEHRHGSDYWVCATRQIAEVVLDNYVKEWWPQDGPDGMSIPKRRDDRIEAFFDDNDREFYSLSNLPLLLEKPDAQALPEDPNEEDEDDEA